MSEEDANCRKCGAYVEAFYASNLKGCCYPCYEELLSTRIREFFSASFDLLIFIVALPCDMARVHFQWYLNRRRFPYSLAELREQAKRKFEKKAVVDTYVQGVVDGHSRKGWPAAPGEGNFAYLDGFSDGKALELKLVSLSDLPREREGGITKG